MPCHCGIVIIDLEKDGVALGFKRTKVMFSVWVVGVAKVVIDFDGFDELVEWWDREGRAVKRAGRALHLRGQGHVWTAPSWQGESSRRRLGRCSHVFGL